MATKITKSELKQMIREALREELLNRQLTEDIDQEGYVKNAISRLTNKFQDLNFDFDPSLAVEMPMDCDSVIKVTSKSGKPMGYGFNDDFMTDDDEFNGPELTNECERACLQFRLDPDVRNMGIQLKTFLDDVSTVNDTHLMTLYMMLLY
jgi:hypothetical protein